MMLFFRSGLGSILSYPEIFLEMLQSLSFKKKKMSSLRKTVTSFSILLRPIHDFLNLWISETADPPMVPTCGMASPRGAWAYV